ncbi:uncharacterized protein F5891DRAFT_1107837 [Suillus fuscotomentosus]|uniref:Fungal-type protein kinase domain-containing protein n=1 Tax=Suillus fuscotomentosus TaxID=1912939 RepID=A0AAD4HL75_9AGAM|nr:uncharacterized protein F5891DRAFT_1107837 [Suillus fuscotomentosus]KAG1901770.1 hypothetical protein F5891DRAFT_1107837 [Suillus fuscotomentosus]
MANNASATRQKTPPCNSTFSGEAELKYTPKAIGFIVVNEHNCAIGVQVDDIRPWIAQDVHKFGKCKAQAILQKPQARCTGLNRAFEPEPGFSSDAMAKGTQIDLKLELKFDKCMTCICMRGRTTIVFSVKSKALSDLQLDFQFEPPELVAKLYWPEDTYQSEPVIFDEVCKITQINSDALRHAPGLGFYKLKKTSTCKISIASGLKDVDQVKPSSRILKIIASRKLIPITTLSGKEFLTSWWQIVKCHRALWKIGVHHRDISPSNLTGYRTHGQFTGVLNDYDLSLFQRDSPNSLERTGTVLFMALDRLIPESMAGKVEHVYAHDAESFIWALTWICLRYEEGKLLSKNRPLEKWPKVDARTCAEEKANFLLGRIRDVRPSGSHEVSWEAVKKCFLGIHSLYSPFGYRKVADQLVFELLLENPMQGHL